MIRELNKALADVEKQLASQESKLKSETQSHMDAQEEVERLQAAMTAIIAASKSADHIQVLMKKLQEGEITQEEFVHISSQPVIGEVVEKHADHGAILTLTEQEKRQILERCRGIMKQMTQSRTRITFEGMRTKLVKEFGDAAFELLKKNIGDIMTGADPTPANDPTAVWVVRRPPKDPRKHTGLRRLATASQDKVVFYRPHRKVKNGTLVNCLQDHVRPADGPGPEFAEIRVIDNPTITGFLQRSYLHQSSRWVQPGV